MKNTNILQNFIVFEGIDGAGKSSQVSLVAKKLQHQRINTVTTCEPHDGIIGTFIRKLLNNNILQDYDSIIASSIFSFLFAADRYEHIYSNDGILKKLQDNAVVICDRYIFSSIVYQQESHIPFLSHTLNQNFPMPSLLIYFDMPPKIAIQRIKNRNKDIMENLEVLERVYDTYQTTLSYFHQRHKDMEIVHIDANQPTNTITQKIFSIITSHILNKK